MKKFKNNIGGKFGAKVLNGRGEKGIANKPNARETNYAAIAVEAVENLIY